MTDEARYRRALWRIAKYDAARKSGYVDEWAVADAYDVVKRIAREALDPGERDRRVAAQSAARQATMRAIHALKKNKRYFYIDCRASGYGAWVRFLKGDGDRAHDGIIRVRVLERVGSFPSTTWYPGNEIAVHVSNIQDSP